GGFDAATAAEAVTEAFDAAVALRFDRTRIEVAPSLLGLTVPVEAAVARALTAPANTKLALRASINTALVRAFVAKIAARFDREPVASQLLLRNSRPLVTKAVIGRTLDQSAGVRALRDSLVHGTRHTIVLRAKLTQPAT